MSALLLLSFQNCAEFTSSFESLYVKTGSGDQGSLDDDECGEDGLCYYDPLKIEGFTPGPLIGSKNERCQIVQNPMMVYKKPNVVKQILDLNFQISNSDVVVLTQAYKTDSVDSVVALQSKAFFVSVREDVNETYYYLAVLNSNNQVRCKTEMAKIVYKKPSCNLQVTTSYVHPGESAGIIINHNLGAYLDSLKVGWVRKKDGAIYDNQSKWEALNAYSKTYGPFDEKGDQHGYYEFAATLRDNKTNQDVCVTPFAGFKALTLSESIIIKNGGGGNGSGGGGGGGGGGGTNPPPGVTPTQCKTKSITINCQVTRRFCDMDNYDQPFINEETLYNQNVSAQLPVIQIGGGTSEYTTPRVSPTIDPAYRVDRLQTYYICGYQVDKVTGWDQSGFGNSQCNLVKDEVPADGCN